MPLKKDLGQWISHFEKSDAPQFKRTSEEERKNMALAAFRAKYGSLNEAYTSATNNELAQYIATLKDELAYYKQKKDSKRIDMTKKDLADVKAELESRRAKRGVNEASEEEETKFHKKLDTLVHNTFGKREDEMEEAFSKKYDNDPTLKGGQEKLPDALQKAIMKAKKKMEEASDSPEEQNAVKLSVAAEKAKIAAANKKIQDLNKGVAMETLKEGREFDYEGSMARTQLFSIIKNSKALFDQIDDRTQLQGWVQSKLTKAEDYIDAVRTYLEGESLSTTTPLVVSEEMMKDEEGASLNIGDVVKAGDGGIYQVIFSYMEGKPFLVPFDLKKRKPTNLRNRIYFDSDSMIVRKLHKVMPFSATKGGFMK